MELFQDLLDKNPSVFHQCRSPKALRNHWLLMRQYQLLSDQTGNKGNQTMHCSFIVTLVCSFVCLFVLCTYIYSLVSQSVSVGRSIFQSVRQAGRQAVGKSLSVHHLSSYQTDRQTDSKRTKVNDNNQMTAIACL